MSRLPNAPLQEVSAQMKWHLKREDFSAYDFFAGDYYHLIKDTFNEREGIAPEGLPLFLLMNNPAHKFKKSGLDFPFIILGPGIVAINVNDDGYDWGNYKNEIVFSFSPIFQLVPNISEFDHIHLSLEYIDFFEFNFQKDNIFHFLKTSLNTGFEQSFMSENVEGLDLNLSYNTDLGSIKFNYTKGEVKGKKEGLIVRTSIASGIHSPNLSDTKKWFDLAHQRCSQLFKEMTKGKLYESFC